MSHSNKTYKLSEQDSMIIDMEPAAAIEMIMDTYGDEIKRLVFTYVKNNADTDDVSQEVFVTVYKKLHTFQGKSSLKSWIYSIAINKCKDYLRSWHIRNKNLTNRLRKAVQFRNKTHSSPEQDIVKRSESDGIIEQVMEMPLKYREAIILFYFKEFSIKEMSEILNMNEATIRTRLFRARGQLKELLSAERGGEIG